MAGRLLISLGMCFTLVFLTGCPTAPPGKNETKGNAHDHGDEHGHADHGPHGGMLLVSGDHKHHFELVFGDGDTFTLYPLDGKVAKPVSVATQTALINLKAGGKPRQFELHAAPDSGDAQGQTTRFQAVSSELHEALESKEAKDAELVVTVDDKQVRCRFEAFHDHSQCEHDHHGHGHEHEHDDKLIMDQDEELEGHQIKLGRHGLVIHSGHDVEAAVQILHDGKPVADAEVFATLLDADGKTVLAAEMAAVFEEATEEEPAHYGQASLAVPADQEQVIIRYRIVLPGDASDTFDTPVTNTETEDE
ncbi:MAG: hypothetical protein WBF93_10625 [Pirellulales bacterium]|nr:hypothetical protein [Pirellulales bacterium]